MKIISSPRILQRRVLLWKKQGFSIGLVPTMGALHPGHLSLIRRALRENNRVIVSVFVNPLQFGPKEDYARYPRPFARDQSLCRKTGAHILFHPSAHGLYQPGFATHAEVDRWSDLLCGAFRPGHFRGVATVVLKLLNLAQPNRAYFGEKDFQQLQIIRKIVEDLNLPVRVVGCPTVRERDGLALSSRNAYLKPDERAIAPLLYHTLCQGAFLSRDRNATPISIENWIRRRLSRLPKLKIDYVRVVEAGTLERALKLKRALRIVAAVWLKKTRLIDNIPLLCKNAPPASR